VTDRASSTPSTTTSQIFPSQHARTSSPNPSQSQSSNPTQAYHSIFLQDQDVRVIGNPPPPQQQQQFPPHLNQLTPPPPGNFALLPLRTRTRGPAYTLPALAPGTSDLDIDPDSESYDPLDEVLSLFRANTFFRNFEIKGPADRLLIYGILFVSECLGKIKGGMGGKEAEKVCVFSVWKVCCSQ